MRRLLLPTLLAVACGMCVAGPAQLPQREAARIAHDAKRVLLDNLKDPGSAKFRALFLSRTEPLGDAGLRAVVLCGEVNAKNGYGGYTGFKRFYAHPTSLASVKPEDEIGSSVFDAMWEKQCTSKVTDIK